MNENTRGFCISCGVARNHGDTCDYCGRHYVDPIEATQKTKRVTALSAKYRIIDNKHGKVITWPWKGRSGWVLIPFAMIWLSLTVPIAAEYFEAPIDTLPIKLLPTLIGIFILCNGIMNLVNKTSIFASPQSLYLKHHPIPWRGKFKIATNNIEQVFVSSVRRSNKETSWQAPALQIITKDGQKHELLRGKAEAEFMDFESLRLIILKALKIKPETVSGSYDSVP